MSTHTFRRPRLPSHYYVLYDPPDSAGDEVLHFISECRKIKLKGYSLREFHRSVVPLLDGQHTLEEIENEVSDLFAPPDLEACLALLAEHNLLEEADERLLSSEASMHLEPQRNFFHEVSLDPDQVQQQLANATVAILGLGGAGAHAALALAAARVGTLRCIDSHLVTPADPYLAAVFSLSDVGTARVDAVRRSVAAIAPHVNILAHHAPLETDADVLAAVQGADFALCCVDAAQSAVAYKLNRVCLQMGLRWTSCAAAGPEVIIGPTVHPFETACYLCYKMRAVTCAENPEDAFAFQRFLDHRKQDDSGRRENVVFGTGLAGHLIGLEALKELTGMTPPAVLGRIAVIDLLGLTLKKHLVLRKPWCPACFGQQAADVTPSHEEGT